MDEPGPGGACHDYKISELAVGDAPFAQRVFFQKGALHEQHEPGVTHEALLAIVIDRLRGFQSGKFFCRENAIALTKLEEAQHWLEHRTKSRIARGVEGTTEL